MYSHIHVYLGVLNTYRRDTRIFWCVYTYKRTLIPVICRFGHPDSAGMLVAVELLCSMQGTVWVYRYILVRVYVHTMVHTCILMRSYI